MPHCQTFDYAAVVQKLGGDEAFARELLAVALRSSASLPDDLRAACGVADHAALAKLAHRFKGTAGDLAARQLHEQARDAELAARAASADAVALNLALAGAIDEFLAELRSVAPAA